MKWRAKFSWEEERTSKKMARTKLSSTFTLLVFLLVVCDKQSHYMNDIDLSQLWTGATEIYVGREIPRIVIWSAISRRVDSKSYAASSPVSTTCLWFISLIQKLVVLNVLLLCGDISLNPHPASLNCLLCCKPTKKSNLIYSVFTFIWNVLTPILT